MSLVKVWTELDDGKCYSLPAKIVSKKTGGILTVRYISSTKDRDSKNRKIYRYEDDTYDVTDESITEYLETDSELDLGFEQISESNFVKYDNDDDSDSDRDYDPEEDDEDDDDDDEDIDENASFEDDDEDEYSSGGGGD